MAKFNWDEGNLDLFWHWIAERQTAFYNRHVAGNPPPWTSDPVIAGNHFTNVYRELDPGTKWVRRHVLEQPGLMDEQRAFLVFAYRLFGTEAVFERLGVHSAGKHPNHPMLPENFDESWVAQSLQSLMDHGVQAFTPAYMVSNYGRSEPKPVVIANVLATAASTWDSTWFDVFMAANRQEAFNALQRVYGMGRFVAFQTLVDLCYPRAMVNEKGERSLHEGLLPFSNDDWVAAGPGAMKGLGLLLPGVKQAQDNEAIAALCKMQRGPLDERGMPWLLDHKSRPVLVHRSDMQNCLCEFSKYHRLVNEPGKGGRKRLFDCRAANQRDSDAADQERTHTGPVRAAVQVDAFRGL